MGFRRTDEEGRPVRYRRWKLLMGRKARDYEIENTAIGLHGLLADRMHARKEAQRKERETAIADGSRGVDRVPERYRVQVPEPVVLVPAPEPVSRADSRGARRMASYAERPARRAAARQAREQEREELRLRAAAILAARRQP